MEVKWITVNTKLLNGVHLINSLTTKTLQLLLTHISNSKTENPFTDEELEKLRTSLKLNEDSLQLLVQAISHIFKQSCKVMMKPSILQKQLIEHLGFNTEKAEEFVKIWSNKTNEHFGDFENGMKLENVSWELNVQCADQISNKQSLPVARVQFKLSKLKNEREKENVTIEMDQSELLQFYNTLESIQMKLDTMQNIGN
ncbi:COMM domain-containing protein 10 [Leptinotarsa decemlineata]|uniref:COMM domain-containing protein 10 n=1 Tax=Leptinotarsa decemlineata TaxID=7539 RepID=UPI003D30852C